MRRAILTLASLMIFLTITLAWARTHPGPLEVRPPIEATAEPNGDDQAEVIVREIEMVSSDEPGNGIDATQGSPLMMRFAYIVNFEVTKVLRGRLWTGRKLRIFVHSPSTDLGVRGGSRRGVLHRYREGGSDGRYEFVPE